MQRAAKPTEEDLEVILAGEKMGWVKKKRDKRIQEWNKCWVNVGQNMIIHDVHII